MFLPKNTTQRARQHKTVGNVWLNEHPLQAIRMLGVKLSDSWRDVRWVALAFLISLGFWYWALHILAPANAAVVYAAHRPVGNNSDLYARWLGAREVFLHRRDPYSAEVTREIQTGFYGRPLDPANPSDPKAQESFVYPLYIVFLLAPVMELPFHTVAVIFRWLLLASVTASVPLWMCAIRLRWTWTGLMAGMLLATSTSPAMYEYFQQNLAAIALLFLAGAAATLAAGRLPLAGVMLALSTIKPDTSGLVVLWLLIWAAANIRERGRLLWWFLGSLGALIIGAEIYSPHWIGRFFKAVREYSSYGTDPSVIQVLLPVPLAMLVTAALVAYVAILCWKWRQSAAGSEHFGWVLALVGATTLVILPKLAAYNALLLIPGLLVLIAQSPRSSKSSVLSRALTKAAFGCQIWQWISAGLLSLGSLVLPPHWIQSAAHLPDYTFIPLWPITLLALIAVTAPARKKESQQVS